MQPGLFPTRTPTSKATTQPRTPTLTLQELIDEFPLSFYEEGSNQKRMDFYFILFLKSIEDELEGAAAGIAKKIIANAKTNALAMLSERQLFVLKHYILDEHAVTGYCEICGGEFTWEDQSFIEPFDPTCEQESEENAHENCLAHAWGEDQD